MLENFIKSIFWDPSEKKVKEITKLINDIKEIEKNQKNFSLEDVKNKTEEFKKMFEWLDFTKEDDSKKILKILNNIRLEAFALVRTTCKLINWKGFLLSNWDMLTWNMIPYDVQLVWGLAIHEGNISEMKTW